MNYEITSLIQHKMDIEEHLSETYIHYDKPYMAITFNNKTTTTHIYNKHIQYTIHQHIKPYNMQFKLNSRQLHTTSIQLTVSQVNKNEEGLDNEPMKG